MLVAGVLLDLRKRFEQEPISTAVQLDSAAQLQCLPPAGQPTPEVCVIALADIIGLLTEFSAGCDYLNVTRSSATVEIARI